jgi:nifR3 family TIM-barrel protein
LKGELPKFAAYSAYIVIKIGTLELPDFPLLLAPMEDVSDPPFRAACKDNGADLMYTEFISVEGLVRDAEKSLHKLDIYDEERPIGIQRFGGEIESMIEGAAIAEAANPELVDINYGCPVTKVTCKGAGAGILKDIPKMIRMTEEIVKRVNKPVTVKTRLGWDHDSINVIEVTERLQDIGVQAITIHARTRVQMYKGEADWTWLARIKDAGKLTIPLFGNGDIDSPEKAVEYQKLYGVDGVMIGRASIGYPWIFQEIKHYRKTGLKLPVPSMDQRIDVCKKHLENSIAWKGERVGIVEMRRHYSNYFKGIPDFKPYRMRLVTSENPTEIFDILSEISSVFADAFEHLAA